MSADDSDQQLTMVTAVVIAVTVFTLLVSFVRGASILLAWQRKRRTASRSAGERTATVATDLEAHAHVVARLEAELEAQNQRDSVSANAPAGTAAELQAQSSWAQWHLPQHARTSRGGTAEEHTAVAVAVQQSIDCIEDNCGGEIEECEHSGSSDCFTSMDLKGIVELGVEEQWYIFDDQVKLDSSDTLEGAFASVRRGVLFGDQQVAVKVPKSFTNDLSGAMALANEIRLYRRMRHPNIVLCHGVSILKLPSPLPCLVLEWVDGGNLSTFVSMRRNNGEFMQDCKDVFSSEEARRDMSNLELLQETKFLIDVAWGMTYLHSQKPVILHMDLKPQNILIQRSGPPAAKLADFGLAMLLDQDVRRSNVGTARYMAPEVQKNAAYQKPAEVYSFGLTVAFAVSGQHPPKTKPANGMSTLHHQMTQMLQVPHLPRELVKICTKCLSPKPASRPSFAELCLRLAGGVRDNCRQSSQLQSSSGEKNQNQSRSTAGTPGTSGNSDSSLSLSWSDRELSVRSNLSGARIDKVAKSSRESNDGSHAGSEQTDMEPKIRNNGKDAVQISL